MRGEIARSLDLVERRNGRRFLATYTEKGFVIVASGIGKFRESLSLRSSELVEY